MTKYAVGYINFFYNVLKIEFIEANNWKEALAKHSSCLDENGNPDDNSWLSDDMEEAQEEAINSDFMFDVRKVE